MIFRPLLALLVALVAGLVDSSAQTLAAPPAPEDGYIQDVTAVTPGVWVFAQPRFQVQPAGNVTVIEQSDGLVLVDAGGSPGAARRIVTAIRRLSAKPVKAVVITHWHGDHPQGLSEILRAWPRARTIATKATQAHLRDPKTMNTPASTDAEADAAFQKQVTGFSAYAHRMATNASDPREEAGWAASERLFHQYALDMAGAVTVSTTESFDDRLDIPDPATPIQVRFLGRANTDGDAIVWLPTRRVLVSGDIVVAPFPFGFGSYPREWLETLERLQAYDFQTLVPGHGPPQQDRAYLDRLARALADVRNQVGPMAGSASLDEVRKQFDPTAQLREFAGDDPWLQHWVKDYWITPILRSAYKEARGEPIVQSLRGE